MSWLTPLGFLGALGIVALIIIYIIKPNFQNKLISSTYVWKLSLKYKKKKIPTSTLRNILIFICQVLILSAATFILAQPFIKSDKGDETTESVVIIDASASMLSSTAGSTRLERAIYEANAFIDKAFEEEKSVSVIVATDKAYFIAQQATAESAALIKADINAIIDENNPTYTYGAPDIEGAMNLAEEITAYCLDSEVVMFTDTNYIDAGNVKVVDVKDNADWNGAILNVRSRIVENLYTFEIDVVCYGADMDLTLYCDFSGVNEAESTINHKIPVRCTRDEIQTIIFSVDPEMRSEHVDDFEAISSFRDLHVHIAELDSLAEDNSFYLYGGKRPVLKVQYASAMPNNFFASALMVLREQLGNYWDIEITEIRTKEEPASEGFDLYIYEYEMPTVIPTDGIVMLWSPETPLPASTGIQLGQLHGFVPPSNATNWEGASLTKGDDHPILKNVNVESIKITQFRGINNYDGYTPIMYADSEDGGKPVVLVRNEPDSKIVVAAFGHRFSNFAILHDFPLFMYNMLNYFAPQTFDGYVFDANESIDLNARGETLKVTGPGTDATLTTFPANIQLSKPGTYTVSQTVLSGDPVIEEFYVKIPSNESNIYLNVDTLENPYFYQETAESDLDLLIYFAATMVALLFIEWWLKSREQI